jgi:Tfp pilus assembly protein PilW
MNQRGFSLIEIILYISLSGIILFTTAVTFISVLDARTKNQTIAIVDQEGAKAMSIITQTVRNANAINSPTAGNSASTLSVNTGSSDPKVFTLTNGAITMQEGGGEAVALTSSLVTISNLNFRNLSGTSSPGNVDVTFTVARRQ